MHAPTKAAAAITRSHPAVKVKVVAQVCYNAADAASRTCSWGAASENPTVHLWAGQWGPGHQTDDKGSGAGFPYEQLFGGRGGGGGWEGQGASGVTETANV